MASKTVSGYDDKLGSGPRRTAAVELPIRSEAEPSVMAFLPPNSPSFCEDSRLRNLQTELLGSANYRVALVPPATPAPQFRAGTSEPAHRILLLPLTWKEVLARLRAEVTPSRSLQHSVVRFGAVCVDLYRSEVSRADSPVVLTALEFKLLRFFVTSPRRVISRDELLDEVWGFENYPCTRTVDNHVLRLRKKLEQDPARPVHFQTVHGVGYRFVFEAGWTAAEQQM